MRQLVVALAVASSASHAHALRAQNAPAGRSFGDSTEYGVQLLSIKPDSEVATFRAKNSKHLVVLEIIPGQSVDVLVPGGIPGGMPIKKLKDSNTYALSMYRFITAPNTAADEAAERNAEAAYKRCVAAADAAARRAAAARRTRDASGKETGPTISQVMGATSDASSNNICGRSRPATAPPKFVRLPPRAPADRYLVVLSSPAGMSLVEVSERLAQLTTVGSDVATTVEALAAGLFFGKAEKWGGAFIPW